jgi:DNA gyrase subunit A
MGRATQGVRLINIQDNDSIAAITKVDHEEDEVTEVVNEGTVEITETPSAPETPNENNGAESNDQAETKED